MAQHNEASVEEILESIKKVIARDSDDKDFLIKRPRENAEEDLVEAPKAPAATQQSSGADEVLDLADMEYLGDEGLVEPEAEEAVGHTAPDPAPASSMEDELVLSAPFEEGSGSEELPPLTTEAAAGAMRDNLAALAMLSEPPARPQIVRSGETSLESLARDMMRPMLAEWLDKNLPAMVEKMVQAEIARIAGKRK
jgi:hypothetical protein